MATWSSSGIFHPFAEAIERGDEPGEVEIDHDPGSGWRTARCGAARKDLDNDHASTQQDTPGDDR